MFHYHPKDGVRLTALKTARPAQPWSLQMLFEMSKDRCAKLHARLCNLTAHKLRNSISSQSSSLLNRLTVGDHSALLTCPPGAHHIPSNASSQLRDCWAYSRAVWHQKGPAVFHSFALTLRFPWLCWHEPVIFVARLGFASLKCQNGTVPEITWRKGWSARRGLGCTASHHCLSRHGATAWILAAQVRQGEYPTMLPSQRMKAKQS